MEARIGALLDPDDLPGARPEAFEVVSLARGAIEYVDHDSSVVQKNPPSRSGSLAMKWTQAPFAEAALNVIANGVQVPPGLAGHDNEIVSEIAYSGDIEQGDV
jgi:hypothetical protein